MELERKKTGGGGKILGIRLQWEGHVDRERYGSRRKEDRRWKEDNWDEAATGRACMKGITGKKGSSSPTRRAWKRNHTP